MEEIRYDLGSGAPIEQIIERKCKKAETQKEKFQRIWKCVEQVLKMIEKEEITSK